MSVVNIDQPIQVYNEETQQPQLIYQGVLNPCAKCGKQLRESRTGRYPFGDGYICNSCRDLVAEEFRQAVNKYNAPDPEDAMPVDELVRQFLS
jgi:recombinational DNA repair protein (RecF pathway)